LSDSPVGLATFLLDHDARSLELIARSFDGVKEGLTRDDVLDNVTLFWLTKYRRIRVRDSTPSPRQRLENSSASSRERREDPGGR